MRCIKDYEVVSGQRINQRKIALFFNSNTAEAIQNEVRFFWGAESTSNYEKYLGLPTFIGRGKFAAFATIQDKVWKRVQGWHDKLLSATGK